MDALKGIDDDVRFDYRAADELAGEFRAGARLLRRQADGRSRLADNALQQWKGRYATQFKERKVQAAQQASGLAGAMEQAARDIDALKQAAEAEQDRREQARQWKEEHAE